MAPHNVLEKLARQNQRKNAKYAIDTNDNSGNAPIKEHGSDYGRELIQNGNGNVKDFSLEDEENVDFMKTTQSAQNLLNRDFNNIQVIGKTNKQPLNVIPMANKIQFDLKAKTEVHNVPNRNKSEGVSEFQLVEVEMKSIPQNESISDTRLPSANETIVTDPTYTAAEELLSNPTTSQNLISTLVREPEDKFESMEIPTEINDSTHRIGSEEVVHLPLEASTENSIPIVVLKILKNRTVLVEETMPQSTSDQFVVQTTSVPKIVTPLVRPKKKTGPTTSSSAPVEVKRPQKKATLVDLNKKHKNAAPKLDGVSLELTEETNLLNVETPAVPSQSESSAKSKNTKRAIGDEGSFASNFVRPSPMRPTDFRDIFPRESASQRADRLSGSMQRLMHFVTIVGHVDSYLTKRVRKGLKNVARIFSDSMENTRRRR